MPLGTLDRTPPPFFRQGTSALTKLTFFSALALFLMVADTRFKVTQPLRSAMMTVLHPVQRALQVPAEAWGGGSDYVDGLRAALAREAVARKQLAALSERAARVEQLTAENTQLRALVDMRPALTVKSMAAEVLYDAPDPYSRKVIIDRGQNQGVREGAPVINEAGVLGQVTRLYPLSAEVTLLTDKDAVIPVLNPRTGHRSVAFGAANGGGLELRFMAGNADVQVGDVLTTSGVDGVYPPGIAVAKVVTVTRKADSGFARIDLQPAAWPDALRHVLVLEPVGLQQPPRPAPEVTEPVRKSSSSSAAARKGARAASAAASAASAAKGSP
jgi:rod shape-determining protein MreC